LLFSESESDSDPEQLTSDAGEETIPFEPHTQVTNSHTRRNIREATSKITQEQASTDILRERKLTQELSSNTQNKKVKNFTGKQYTIMVDKVRKLRNE